MSAPRVHHAARRGGGSMAACGAGAAGRADAAHRRAYEPGRGRSGRAGPQHCLRAGASAIGLGRRPKPADRTSLGCGRMPTASADTPPNWSRSPRMSYWPLALPAWQPLLQATRTVPIVFVLVPDPVGCRLRRQLGAAGRQCDRICPVRIRHQRKMAGAAQGDRAGRDARGSPSRPCHCRRARARSPRSRRWRRHLAWR